MGMTADQQVPGSRRRQHRLLQPLCGLDVRTITSPSDFDVRVRQPWLASGGVLLLRGQSPQLTAAQLVSFSQHLGELDIHVAEQFLLPGQVRSELRQAPVSWYNIYSPVDATMLLALCGDS